MATTAEPTPQYTDDAEYAPSGLGVLFHAYKPERPGTMPAGLVLILLVGALLLAALFNADATLRKANARDRGPWRQEVASVVQSVSDHLYLNRPHNFIDEKLGKQAVPVQQVESTDDLLAEKKAEDAAAGAGGSTTTTAVPGKPVLRAPTPASPLSVWVGGDSVAGSFGPGFQRVANTSKLFNVTVEAKVSSGLTNQAYYNWPKALRDVAKTANPDIMIVMFGANDAQNMAMGNSGLERFTPAWYAEYRKRVGSTMDLLQSPDNHRLVVWVGQPVMSPTSAAAGMDRLDYIYWSEAAKRPWVAYVDAWPYFTDAAGGFAQRLPAADGKEQKLRENDGVHLTPQGADRLAWVVYHRLGDYVDLSAGGVIPPAAQIAPLDVTERPEVPKPPDMNE